MVMVEDLPPSPITLLLQLGGVADLMVMVMVLVLVRCQWCDVNGAM